MKIKHNYESINGINTLVLYVNYSDKEEFGIDFDDYKSKVKNAVQSIKNYIRKNLNNISDNTALLVLNGIVVGTLTLGSVTMPNDLIINEIKPIDQIEESINNDTNKTNESTINDDIINTDEKIEESNDMTENQTVEDQKTEEKSTLHTENNISPNSINKTNNTQTTNQTQNNNKAPSQGSTSAPTPTPNPQPAPEPAPTYNGQVISVKLASGQIIQTGLEDYVTNVVCSEMPALFEIEALKAQSVAARTYALKKISSGATLSATVSDQVYKTDTELKAMWQGSYNQYYNKVKSAVESTRGQTIKYNGAYIDALYFSTSNGKTEDAVNVWGNSIPYLKSVTCNFDIGTKLYKKEKVISKSEVSKKLGVTINSASDFNIISKTEGNRVKDVSVCGKTFTGVKIRSLLGLNSADFEVTDSGNNLIFSNRGYGHGVGMSQYGANEMAKQGYSYINILKYFYTGVTVSA